LGVSQHCLDILDIVRSDLANPVISKTLFRRPRKHSSHLGEACYGDAWRERAAVPYDVVNGEGYKVNVKTSCEGDLMLHIDRYYRGDFVRWGVGAFTYVAQIIGFFDYENEVC
jgi:hypothetical protein